MIVLQVTTEALSIATLISPIPGTGWSEAQRFVSSNQSRTCTSHGLRVVHCRLTVHTSDHHWKPHIIWHTVLHLVIIFFKFYGSVADQTLTLRPGTRVTKPFKLDPDIRCTRVCVIVASFDSLLTVEFGIYVLYILYSLNHKPTVKIFLGFGSQNRHDRIELDNCCY